MARSVVLNNTVRCQRCLLLPRWCICSGLHPIESALAIEVLMHDREAQRPTSTGHLIGRVFPAARTHIHRPERPIAAELPVDPSRELWILHPNGEDMPTNADPRSIRVLLLDANWPQSTFMLKQCAGLGRRVRLPMSGQSRYWLRAQQGEGQFSTAEALLFLLGALGLEETRREFNLLFELHVFASLSLRGNRPLAEKFLATSPIQEAFPDLIARLRSKHAPRAALTAPEDPVS